MSPTYAVLGAGHGGLALAGHLGSKGLRVTLWARRPSSLAGVAAAGGVRLTGALAGFGKVTPILDLGEVIRTANVILVCVPASAHRELAERCRPFLRPDQVVLLLPGRTAGAIEFLHALGMMAPPLVGETATFPFASRCTGPARAHIHGVKRHVLAAALPGEFTPLLLARLRSALPQLVAASSIWETSLDNIGAVFHPAVLLMNAARVETTGGDFRHYLDGISPSIAGLLERLDQERVAVAHALGVPALTAREWLADAYGVLAPSLYEAIQRTPAYAAVAAPASLDHRYVWEDVPTGLVPIAALGDALGVTTPTTNLVIDLARTLTGEDHRASGRTLPRLGLADCTADDLRRLALEGDVMLDA